MKKVAAKRKRAYADMESESALDRAQEIIWEGAHRFPLTESAQRIKKPEITTTFQFDLVALGRFNIKVALG